MKALIIDDSAQARKLLRLMLAELAPEIVLLAEARNGEEGLLFIEEHQPDFVFLDIEMPHKSGLELAQELIAKNISCEIIFTTAYNEYAIKAFRLSAIDYLLKPINESQLVEAVEKVKEKLQLRQSAMRLKTLTQNLKSTADNVLCIPTLSGYDAVPLSQIEYLEADGSYVHIFLADKKQKTASKNLKYFEQILEVYPQFLRVHRSFLINFNLMAAFSRQERGIITMRSGKLIDLARDRRAAFFAMLGEG